MFYEDDRGPRKMKLFVSSENIIFKPMSYLPYKPPVAVVGSCGDLLLLCPDSSYLHSVYYICNPLTGKWFPLPPTPTYPIRLPCSYKDDGGEPVKFGIFTSDSGIWSEKVWTRSPKMPGFPVQNLPGVPYKGMLFWISGYVVDNSHILVGVDPCETLHFKVLPGIPPRGYGSQTLAVCRGILNLLEMETEMNDTKDGLSIRVWDLKDFDKNEWDLKHHINFFGLQSKNPSCACTGTAVPYAFYL